MGSVLLFGRLKDVFGAAQIPFPEGVKTAAALRARLADLYPDHAAQLVTRSVRIAVNQKVTVNETETSLSSSDEIALLPPLSGG